MPHSDGAPAHHYAVSATSETPAARKGDDITDTESSERPTRRRVRLSDVAAAAGVSVPQASAALTGYRGVHPQTRERVRAAAASLGYQPSASARRLRSGRRLVTQCAFVLINSSPRTGLDRFASQMLYGALVRASELGMYMRLVRITAEELADGTAMRTLVAEDGVDGVVVQTYATITAADVEPLNSAGVPVVLLNRHFGLDSTSDAVVADVAAGAEAAIALLQREGRRRVALVLSSQDTQTTRDYRRGWQTAAAAVPDLDARIVAIDHGDPAARLAAAESLLTGDWRPDGIVAVNGDMAHQILTRALAEQVAVPEELSLASFDVAVAGFTLPTMTSYDLRLDRIGATAVDLLAARMDHDRTDQPAGGIHWVTPQLVPGATTRSTEDQPTAR